MTLCDASRSAPGSPCPHFPLACGSVEYNSKHLLPPVISGDEEAKMGLTVSRAVAVRGLMGRPDSPVSWLTRELGKLLRVGSPVGSLSVPLMVWRLAAPRVSDRREEVSAFYDLV